MDSFPTVCNESTIALALRCNSWTDCRRLHVLSTKLVTTLGTSDVVEEDLTNLLCTSNTSKAIASLLEDV